MIRVYAKVVADLMHPGHVEFFRRARELGDHLKVCVVPGERGAGNKGREPVLSTSERVRLVEACRWVDEVITDGPREITPKFMEERGFDLYAFGASDEREFAVKIADCAELPENRRVRVPYSSEISTTMILERIRDRME